MRFGNCRLCLKDKELIHSHVLPEFFYVPTYDDTHRFISVSSHPQQKTKLFEKGLREYLLCKGCEEQFNRYETYSANTLRMAGEYRKPNSNVIEIPNFDYPYFKLFGLSLIWRCHISTLHMFSAVNLGIHAERIRVMLASENPGKPSDYCFIVVKIEADEHANTVIIAPGKSRFQGHVAYILMAYGFEWIFVISSHADKLPNDYPFVGMKPELVLLIEAWSEQRFLQEMRKRMHTLIEKDKRAT